MCRWLVSRQLHVCLGTVGIYFGALVIAVAKQHTVLLSFASLLGYGDRTPNRIVCGQSIVYPDVHIARYGT